MLAVSVSLIGCGVGPWAATSPATSGDAIDLRHEAGAVRFDFTRAYQAQATQADIQQIRVTLSGGALTSPVSQTATFNGGASLSFKSLPAGSIDALVEAFDGSGANIGTASKSGISIVAGQLTTVSLNLKLVPTTVDPGTGMVGVGVVISDGNIVTTPLPSPAPLPSPTLQPSPAPSPAATPVSTPIPAPSATPAPVSTPAPSSALYVSPGGSDANAGTMAAPLKTFATAASRLKPGMTLYVGGGTYYQQLITKVAGTATAPITFTSYNGTAVIDGSKTAKYSPNEGMVELRQAYNRIQGLKIANSANSGVVMMADNLTIQGCTIDQIQNHGITNHLAYHPGGTYPQLHNITIVGNTVSNTCTETPKTSGQAISIGADGFLVSGNTVYGSKDIGIDVWMGATHGEVVDNDVHNDDMGMYVDGASYVRIHDNKMYANTHTGLTVSSEDPLYTTHDIWIYNNLVYDHTTEAGMSCWDPDTGATNLLFANNTLINNQTTFAFFDAPFTNVTIMNNLGYATVAPTYDDSKGSTITYSNNVWMTGLTGFVAAGSKDFRLTSSSPAINKGKALPVLKDDQGRTFTIPTDFAGFNRTVGTAPDAGAYELQ